MNKRHLAPALTALLIATAGSVVAEPLGYPGNTWGTVVYTPSASNGDPKLRAEGIVEQGIDWFRFGDDKWKLNTYAALEYVINSNDTQFTPVVGVKVNRRFSDGSLDLGVRVKNANTFISPNGTDTTSGLQRKVTTQIFATYWFDWNLKKD